MKNTRIVIFGYDELLIASLDFFSEAAKVSAVIFPSTRNDWRAAKVRQIVNDRGHTSLEQPPKAEENEFAEKLSAISPDLIFAWSYPMILSDKILAIPRSGCINLHMGLLPEYRGVNGIRWALLNGEEKTGVTLHYMDSGIDTGDIIARVAFPITAEDDILSLMKKSKMAGLHLLKNCWPQISSGEVHAAPQDESVAKYYSSEMAPSEIIDWSRSNIQIHNLIRASVAPFPGVHTFCSANGLDIKRSVILDSIGSAGAAGTVEKIDDDGVEIATGAGNLLVTEIEIEGLPAPISKLSELGCTVGTQLRNS